jgi:hypothetical protein
MFGYESFWSGVQSVVTHIAFCEEMIRLALPDDTYDWESSLDHWIAVLDWRLGFSDHYPL